MWWDAYSNKYRSTLITKIFYIWGWSTIRFILFNFMKPETAHKIAVHIGIPFISWIERQWENFITIPIVIIVILALRLIAFLPGFSWEYDNNG